MKNIGYEYGWEYIQMKRFYYILTPKTVSLKFGSGMAKSINLVITINLTKTIYLVTINI